jgi:hypothetical protein
MQVYHNEWRYLNGELQLADYFLVTFRKRSFATMHRRNLLKGAGIIALYSSFPAVVSQFLASCNNPDKLAARYFSPEEFESLKHLVDVLLPRTATPGGLDSQTHFFIDIVARDCLAPKDQEIIRNGLKSLDQTDGKRFSSLAPDEKNKLISAVDEQAYKDNPEKAWFRVLKKLALVGHFTSREGMTTALTYVTAPDYKACIPYKKGDKAMSKTFLMYW